MVGMHFLRNAPRDGIAPATASRPWEVHMRMLRFFALALALTAFVAGATYPDPPLIDQSRAAGPTSVPGSLEAP